MKKTLSILMVIATLCAMLAIGVSAEQTNMEVTIPKFSAQPTIDGCVSVEEWGEKTIRMVTEGAATVDDVEIGENEELGLKNFFYYFTVPEMFDTFAYDLWLRWDDDNIYLAAIVDDPDPFSLVSGGGRLYSGDAMQFVVDFAGPSAIMFNDDKNFNYKTDSFNGGRYNKPWAKPKQTPAVTFGLVKGQTPSIVIDGEDLTKPLMEGEEVIRPAAQVGITYVDDGDGTTTIQYEVVVPWIAIDETAAPKAGDALGMGVVALCSDASNVNAWLQWGQGICAVTDTSSQPRETRGGSQAVVLGDETIAPADDYAVATEAVEETTEGLVLTLPDITVRTEAEQTVDPTGGTNAQGQTTTRQSVTGGFRGDDDGLSTGAMIAIICGIVVAVVVVAIVIKKKNS